MPCLDQDVIEGSVSSISGPSLSVMNLLKIMVLSIQANSSAELTEILLSVESHVATVNIKDALWMSNRYELNGEKR